MFWLLRHKDIRLKRNMEEDFQSIKIIPLNHSHKRRRICCGTEVCKLILHDCIVAIENDEFDDSGDENKCKPSCIKVRLLLYQPNAISPLGTVGSLHTLNIDLLKTVVNCVFQEVGKYDSVLDWGWRELRANPSTVEGLARQVFSEVATWLNHIIEGLPGRLSAFGLYWHGNMKLERRLTDVVASILKILPWNLLQNQRLIYCASENEICKEELKLDVASENYFHYDEGGEDDRGMPLCANVRLWFRLRCHNIISFVGVAVDQSCVEGNFFEGVRDIALDHVLSGNQYVAFLGYQDFPFLSLKSSVPVALQIVQAMKHFNILLDFGNPSESLCKIGWAKRKGDMGFMNEIGMSEYKVPKVLHNLVTKKGYFYSLRLIMDELLNGDVRPEPDNSVLHDLVKSFFQDVGHHETVQYWFHRSQRELMKGEELKRFSQILDAHAILGSLEKRYYRQDVVEEKSLLEASATSFKIIPWSYLHNKRPIYRGSEAEICQAELVPEGRVVAVREKYWDDDEYVPEEDLKPFCEEVHLMARLHHPNIVSFEGVAAHQTDIDSNNFGGVRDIVLEYMPNGNLYDALQEDKEFALLPWPTRVLMAFQIAEAMDYTHSVGIIHYDLKPLNILLDLSNPSQPVCKVCDFGLAKEKGDLSFMDAILTRGTPGYQAPEVVYKNSIVTEKVDVYAFGVIMYQLLTGDMRFKPSVYSSEYVLKWYFQDVGHHESVPEWCYCQWREVMKDCFREGSMRPTFFELAARLQHIFEGLQERQTNADGVLVNVSSHGQSS